MGRIDVKVGVYFPFGSRSPQAGYESSPSSKSRAFTKRGLDPQAGFNVPETVRKNGSFGKIHTTLVDLPMSPWSIEPTMRQVGKLMYADGSQMPEVSHVLFRRGE
jgi:hypothetical protein